jgi:hypothetical protein
MRISDHYLEWQRMNPDHKFFLVSSFVVAFLVTIAFFLVCVLWEDHPYYLTVFDYPILSPLIGLCLGEVVCSCRDWYAVRHGFEGAGSRDSLIVSVASVTGAIVGSLVCFCLYLIFS